MRRSVIVLLYLLWLSDGASSDEISTPEITRHYPSSTEDLWQKCITKCSVSSVTQANLLWINGSDIYSSLMITDLNTKLYLVLDYQDKNNYSCVVSSSGVNQTTHLNITRLCQPCREGNVTTILVSEGDAVTLPTNLTEVQDEDRIMWVHKNACIAEFFENSTTYYDSCGFGNRLQLDSKTGSLTINNISKSHSGLYELKITNGPLQECLKKSYNVSVYDPLPVPVITKISTQCSSSSACVVMCSVNVTHVSLSWYNGSRLNSSISVSDLKKSNFLCLEVKYQDTNNYSCVVNNSFTNKTTRLNINELFKVPWYMKCWVIITLPVLGFIGLIVLGVCCWYYKKKCLKDASGSQDEVNANPAQDNGSSDQSTSDNNANTGAPLIAQQPSSSPPPQQSFTLTSLCCKSLQ